MSSFFQSYSGSIYWIALLFACNCGIPDHVFGQGSTVIPYQLISKNSDTLESELHKIRVPFDRTKSNSDSLDLYFLRLKSTNPNPGTPIVYLAGGPGSSGIETAKGVRFPIFLQLLEVADVIVLDQRGTGMSNPLPPCPFRISFELKKPLQKEHYLEKTLGNIDRCLGFWDKQAINLKAFNTTENAKDLEDLRRALGVEKLSFWGLSYGSHLAFEYIRFFEHRIDKMVLASLEGPDETIKYPKDTEDFLFRIAALAEDNYGNTLKYPGLKDKMMEVHQRLRARPLVVPIRNFQGQIDSVGISEFELQVTVSTFFLKNPQDSKSIPKMYSKMYEGDFSEIAIRVATMKQFVFAGIQPMPFAMDMQSGISEERKKEVQRQLDRTILGSGINFLFFEWMNALSFGQLPDGFRKMKKNNVNALLFSGTMDGRTYLKAGKSIASKFKKGRQIVVENGGHDIYEQSPEVVDEMLRFFRGNPGRKKRILIPPTPFL